MSETKNVTVKNKGLLAKASTLASMVGTAMMMAPAVFAGDGGAKAKMVGILTKILPYLAVIGIPIALMGGFKLIMAFRNDQGDAVPAAAKDLAIGLLITMFAAIGGPILSSL